MRIVAIAAVLILMTGCGESKTPEQRAQETCESGYDAIWMSQDFVERALKSPSTAKFPSRVSKDGVRSNYLGDCTHEVWAYVDAQNSFGAMIRTNYYVKLQNKKGTDTWTLLDIQM